MAAEAPPPAAAATPACCCCCYTYACCCLLLLYRLAAYISCGGESERLQVRAGAAGGGWPCHQGDDKNEGFLNKALFEQGTFRTRQFTNKALFEQGRPLPRGDKAAGGGPEDDFEGQKRRAFALVARRLEPAESLDLSYVRYIHVI